MDDSKQRFDNQIGEEYDLFRIASPYHDEIQNRVVEVLKDNLPSEEIIAVIEIGFGTGITSRLILETDSRIKLLGVDNAEIMLAKAENALTSFDKSRFKLTINDAFDFLKSFPDNSINAVVSVWVLHNIDKNHRSNILKEAYRVLKPNGIFINGDKIADSNATKHQEDLEWQLKQFDAFEKIGKPELKKEWVVHYYEDEKLDKILIENEFQNELTSLGFRGYAITDRKYMDAIVFVKK